MTLKQRQLLFLPIILWHTTASALTAVPTDLASYFQPLYAKDAASLSSSRITDMMPAASTDSSHNNNNNNNNNKPLRQQLFTSPIISTLYERILPPLWEMGLRIGGPDAEYHSAASFLGGDGTGVALDLCCGTGFVAVRMAASLDFRHVFALDYSPQMLKECMASVVRTRRRRNHCSDNNNNNNKDDNLLLPLSILRGDAGSLPFQDNCLDAVHWGAAMHCVPDVEQALAEVYRVLKPGGRLYATTFLRPFPDVVFRFFEVDEIKTLAWDAGFDDKNFLEVQGKGVYGVLCAIK